MNNQQQNQEPTFAELVLEELMVMNGNMSRELALAKAENKMLKNNLAKMQQEQAVQAEENVSV